MRPQREVRIRREAAFFDRVAESDPLPVLPTAREDPSLHALLDAAGDVRGLSVLDICCGVGKSTALLAQRGAAAVIGCDVSGGSLEQARQLADRCGVASRIQFALHDLEVTHPQWLGRFDVIVGAYALHHLNLRATMPLLRRYLRPAGRCAFLETSALNPVLRWARARLVGRYGIARYGTLDEHPLSRADIAFIASQLGGCQVTAPYYTFFRILDRQVLHYRFRTASALCAWVDDHLQGMYPLGSYHVVLRCGDQISGRDAWGPPCGPSLRPFTRRVDG